MLTFLRHGETAWNREGRIQGTLDIPLSTNGRWCVEQFAKQFSPGNVKLIWTSPLARARETATILASKWGIDNKHVPICKLDALIERKYGVYQGQRLADLHPKHFAFREDFLQGDGVEPWNHVQRRVWKALRVIAGGPDSAMIIVHGGWLKAMHVLFQTGLEQENAHNLSVFTLERTKLISVLNDHPFEEVAFRL